MGKRGLEKVIRERRRTKEKVLGEARRYAEQLRIKATVVLVGSYARGDFNLWSDGDVIIVSPEPRAKNPLQRLREIDAPPGLRANPLDTRGAIVDDRQAQP